jgi:alanine-glyoxylate transaminase / serine-glyoxylate transaminase / serine-pyruvate transaminase
VGDVTSANAVLTNKMSQVSANLVEPGENALVLHTGYFGDSFADWSVSNTYSRPSTVLNHRDRSLQTYGAKVDQVKAPIGSVVPQSEIEAVLKAKKYKVLTFTHVDTSTGSLSHSLLRMSGS